ncbi:hypothetical protein H072_10968 [Dactylellina haptotyla CBS 200.50]|uniref:Apurinic-apyrimidinic endonuclease 1 n=1 Tax=Dactylellina haptotyla (strain CBS 200.50) TaxID=1284197 RepID=S8B945_DACHA|nr:hypothetical protein H072_10968 [Dactylellina haptotyla CBS 200.50]
MAKRSRKRSPSASEDSPSFSQDSEFEFENISQPATQSLSLGSGGKKTRKAAVAGNAKRRAIESDVDESESDEVKQTKRARRGTIVGKRTGTQNTDGLDLELEVEEVTASITQIKTSKTGLDVKVESVGIKASKKVIKAKGKATPEETPKRKRKTKEEKDAEKMPLAARTPGCLFKVGAHVSSAAGVENAVKNAMRIGSNAFALFLKSQRKWESPPYKPANITAFKKFTKEMGYDPRKHMLPHGSYLVNLAQKDKEKAEKAYAGFVDDLKRAESLDIGLFNFHPGSTLGEPRADALQRIADALNKAHEETRFVKTVLETMAGQGNVIGCKFEDLRDIIALVKDKSRVGVCIDTCHSFSAGYDLRSPDTYRAVMKEFDDVVGFKYLSALHLNDSKAPFNSHRDLHQNIGLGFLGLSAFRNVMNTKEFYDIPMVLETPLADDDVSMWAKEIKLLESLIGLDPDDPRFLTLEKEYADKGATERKAVLEKIDKKENEKAEKEAKRKERAEKKAAKTSSKGEKAKNKSSKSALTKKTKAAKAISDDESSELTELGSDSEGDSSGCGSGHE